MSMFRKLGGIVVALVLSVSLGMGAVRMASAQNGGIVPRGVGICYSSQSAYTTSLLVTLGVCNAYGSLRAGSLSNAPSVELTSSSPTACTSISTAWHHLTTVQDVSGSAQTVSLSIYDEGASPTCAAADLVVKITLPASIPEKFDSYLANGAAYSLSAAPATGIRIFGSTD